VTRLKSGECVESRRIQSVERTAGDVAMGIVRVEHEGLTGESIGGERLSPSMPRTVPREIDYGNEARVV
jgi:hypothetical protein